MLHQTINEIECRKQLKITGDYPDVIIGCSGGGSNFAGMILPFVRDKVNGKNIDIIGVEPASCPTMTKGPFAYDFGDTAQITSLFPNNLLDFVFKIFCPLEPCKIRIHHCRLCRAIDPSFPGQMLQLHRFLPQ